MEAEPEHKQPTCLILSSHLFQRPANQRAVAQA